MNSINLMFILAITMILILIKLATTNTENFEGAQSDPRLANLIRTNNEKIVYETDPYPFHQFQTNATRPKNEENKDNIIDPTTCLHSKKESLLPHTTKRDILYMYDQLQGPVDLGMANKMSATSKHAKQSFVNRSRMNRRAFNKYFVQELEETANKNGWWDNDSLDMEL